MKTMNFPTYTLQTVKGNLSYGYKRNFRKWAFTLETNTRLLAAHGAEQGHKIARIIAGSLKRSGNLVDGLASANIDRVLES
jgi:hypothetical protein